MQTDVKLIMYNRIIELADILLTGDTMAPGWYRGSGVIQKLVTAQFVQYVFKMM